MFRIETAARKGYRFIAPVTQVNRPSEPTVAPPPTVARKWWRVSLCAGAVIVGAYGAFFVWSKFLHPEANRGRSDSGAYAQSRGLSRAGPPNTPIRFSWPPAKKPISRPSGDQK